MLAAETTILLHLKTLRSILFVLHGVVVSLLALIAPKYDFYAHFAAPPLIASLLGIDKSGVIP
jgi:hypothetical protein